jgi:ribosomal protein L35
MHRRPFGGHFLSKKSAARKRGYSGLYELKGSSKQNMKRRLGE